MSNFRLVEVNFISSTLRVAGRDRRIAVFNRKWRMFGRTGLLRWQEPFPEIITGRRMLRHDGWAERRVLLDATVFSWECDSYGRRVCFRATVTSLYPIRCDSIVFAMNIVWFNEHCLMLRSSSGHGRYDTLICSCTKLGTSSERRHFRAMLGS